MQSSTRKVFNRRHIIILSLAVITGVAIALLGMSFTSASPDEDVVAVVNGVTITRDDFMTRLEQDAGEAILGQLITETLIAQSEESYGITVDAGEIINEIEQIKMGFPSEELFMEALEREGLTIERLTEEIKLHLIAEKLTQRGIDVTEEEIEAFFEDNKDLLGEPESFSVRHILVETKDEADEIVKELNTGANFSALAEEKSIDEGSAVNGGYIGFVDENSPLVDSFKDAVFLLDAGELSPPVQSEFGWHIIRVDEKFPERQASLDEYRDSIKQHLLMENARPIEEVIDELIENADIDIRWERYKSLIP